MNILKYENRYIKFIFTKYTSILIFHSRVHEVRVHIFNGDLYYKPSTAKKIIF
jgi:hypothetical protein